MSPGPSRPSSLREVLLQQLSRGPAGGWAAFPQVGSSAQDTPAISRHHLHEDRIPKSLPSAIQAAAAVQVPTPGRENFDMKQQKYKVAEPHKVDQKAAILLCYQKSRLFHSSGVTCDLLLL